MPTAPSPRPRPLPSPSPASLATTSAATSAVTWWLPPTLALHACGFQSDSWRLQFSWRPLLLFIYAPSSPLPLCSPVYPRPHSGPAVHGVQAWHVDAGQCPRGGAADERAPTQVEVRESKGGGGRGREHRGERRSSAAWFVVCLMALYKGEMTTEQFVPPSFYVPPVSLGAWPQPACCHLTRQTWWMGCCLCWGWCRTRWVGCGGAQVMQQCTSELFS